MRSRSEATWQALKTRVAALAQHARALLHRPPFPISLRLTLLYTSILGGLSLIASTSVLVGTSYILYRGIESDVERSAENIAQYLRAGGQAQALPHEKNLLLSGVYLAAGGAAIDETPGALRSRGMLRVVFGETHPLAQLLPEDRAFEILRDKKEYFYRKTRLYPTAGSESLRLSFLRPLSEELKFLEILYELLLWVNAAALLAALLSGIYISRRALRPLQEIMRTAKSIEVRNLGTRIAAGSTKDELSELAAILNRMMDRIECGFETQQRFVSDASHELRTPITVISGYVNMLARWGKDDPQALAEGIDAIRAEAENMNQLIEKLLFLARADQNRQILCKTRFALRDLLEDISQETRLIAPALVVRCDASDACPIRADESAVKQMVRIFVENSIKYTPSGGSLVLGCRETPQGACLFVEDTGIGIAPQEQDRVFERFYRVDASRSKHTGGTGLGLAIAKWIADEHGASISLSSEAQRGTCIVVSFPPTETVAALPSLSH